MIPTELNYPYNVAYDVAQGDETLTQALAELRACGIVTDAEHVSEAAQLISDRDGLAGGSVDPYVWLQAEPRPGLDAQAYALGLCETHLEDVLRDMFTATGAHCVTGPEHYRAAEICLAVADEQEWTDGEYVRLMSAGQVHATLALAAATALADDNLIGQGLSWYGAIHAGVKS